MYLAIEKSQSNEFQKMSSNLHKGHKTATDGCILDALGPFLIDSHHNDANIMKYFLLANTNHLLKWYDINDIVVVDCGFRET